MAKKTIDFNILLTKLSNVFRTDMYIYNYKFCIGGKSSEADNEGRIICILNPECEQVIKDLYKSEYIYFKDIKKAKKEPEKYIEVINDEFSKKLIRNQYKEIMTDIDKTGKWDELLLTEKDVEDIFINRNLHKFFDEDKNIPTLELAKSSFPLLSEKNICDTSIMYKSFGIDNETNIASIVISYVTDWFQIQEYIMYFEID